jgi:hypothetical protein
MSDDIKGYIRSRLLETKYSRPVNSGGELAAVRCCFCGDSAKSNTPHFYIGMKDNGVLQMDCKKCFTQGNVTPEVMHRLGIYDITIDEYLKTILKSVYGKSSFVLFGEEQSKRNIYPNIQKDDSAKIEYIIGRTQIDFTKQDTLNKYKIVLRIKDYLDANNIKYPLATDKMKYLNDVAIGFLSQDCKSISLRDITVDEGPGRYSIMHFTDVGRTPYMYIPPCNVDLLTNEPTIALSEGAFDIMCIQKYFYTEDAVNVIFGATGTRKGYKRTLLKLLHHTCFFGGTIVAYIDNEKDFQIDKYKEEFSLFLPSFTVKLIVNQTDKDFGVMPKENEFFDFKVFKL